MAKCHYSLFSKRCLRKHCAGMGGMCLMLVAIGSVAATGMGTDGVLTRLLPDDRAVVDEGATIYRQHCAICHGENLEGQADWRQRNSTGMLPAPPHDETGHTWHHADDLLFEITKYGPARVINDPDYRSAMPAYEHVLDDDAIVAVLSYIKFRWPEQERRWQDDINNAQLKGLGVVDKSDPILDKLFK